jgi:hypothetical protein
MFGSLLKAALSPIDIAVSVVADVATLGGALTDQDKPYTAKACERLVDNLDQALDPQPKKR